MNMITLITTASFWVLCLYLGIRIFLRTTNKVTEKLAGGPVDPFSAGAIIYPGMMCALATEIALLYTMHISGLGKLLKIIPFL